MTVPNKSAPITSGIVYGEVKNGLVQRVPADGGSAPALVKGVDYYLVVLQDIAFPAARCVFTAQ